MFDLNVGVVIDSGSAFSLMSKAIFQASRRNLKDLTPSPVRLLGAGGSVINDYGFADVELMSILNCNELGTHIWCV